MQLEAYYVLGEGSAADATQHVMRVAVIVHSLNLMDGSHCYNEQDKHKVIVNVRLVDEDKDPIITVDKHGELETCNSLVYASRHEASRQASAPPLAAMHARDVWA